jgi:competence protein ComEA
MRPGLVTIAAEGSVPVRVADVIAAAGGLAAGADTDALNLAAPVADGQRVFVPRRGAEAPAVADVDPDVGANVVSGRSAPDAVSDPSRSIDLNRATAAELEALPGVGPATAAAIVEHRSRRGRFRSPEQLLDVPGIGPAKLAALRERVRV